MTHICVGKLTIIHSDNGLAPSRQCWSIVNWPPSKQLQWKFNRKWNIFIQENSLENIVCKMSDILSRSQCVKNLLNLLLYSSAIGYWKPNFTSHIYIYIYIYICMFFICNFHTSDIHFHAPGLSELTETTLIACSFIRRQWANHLLGLGIGENSNGDGKQWVSFTECWCPLETWFYYLDSTFMCI